MNIIQKLKSLLNSIFHGIRAYGLKLIKEIQKPRPQFHHIPKMCAKNSFGDNQENQQSNPMDQLLQILQQLNKPNQNSNESFSQNVILTEKLNNQNYMNWSKLMYLAINGKRTTQSYHCRFSFRN